MITNQTLRHLIDLEMEYRGKDPFTSPEGKVGNYIGSGDGKVTGEFNGDIFWDLYEEIDGGVCLTNFAGRIEAANGETIHFDARGHGLVPDPDKPSEWIMTYGVKFVTTADPYIWLNKTLGVWEGEFNMETYKHNYRIYTYQKGLEN
ncbi:MAG: hypothetical protein DWQ07_18025 [Chloroflexi bacterium]|nr:MAG: hypothetical protein DWQ07_18025 [Chloroflexota bacterium]